MWCMLVASGYNAAWQLTYNIDCCILWTLYNLSACSFVLPKHCWLVCLV
jgi:hypothetical protein